MAMDVRARGITTLHQWLSERGWSTREERTRGQVSVIATRNGEERRIRLSTKSAGTWQTSTTNTPFTDGTHPDRHWAFIDLSQRVPKVRIFPEQDVRLVIAREYAAYLRRHGGQRPVTRSSTHHAVRKPIIQELERDTSTTW
jgi:hypothetical protein